jgi:hypothetical protein
MSMTARDRVQSRLTYLWRLELIGIAVWSILVWLWWDRARLSAATLVGLGLVVLLLTQGSFYWYVKLRAIRRRPLLSDRVFILLFRLFRATDEIMLVASGLVGLAWIAGRLGSLGPDLTIGIGLWTLAVLEYVNYFHWQLLYDSLAEIRWVLGNRRLKVSSLARDLAGEGL